MRKVVDTVNDLDNVLYEIMNETAIFSRDWQHHMIRYIKDYERTKPAQHPVGMTSFDASWEDCEREHHIEVLLSSSADWISPCGEEKANYVTSPPPSTGSKVVLSDMDHLFGIGGDHTWVWKSFLRGLNPIYMDPLDFLTGRTQDPPDAGAVRRAMGDTRAYAERMDLAAMVPREELCSTTYCLANLGSEYLVYLPFGSHWLEPYLRRLPSRRLRAWVAASRFLRRTVTVQLGAISRSWAIEWFDPRTSIMRTGERIVGRGQQACTAPFAGDAVLHLTAS